jgi:hypothetical protein
MRFVGIDPGQTGNCVVIGDDGLTVLDEQGWTGAEMRQLASGSWRVRWSRLHSSGSTSCHQDFVGKGTAAQFLVEHHRTPPAITILQRGDVVVLEAQHVGGPHASLVLSEWCGRLIATLPEGITLLRPLATSWRAKVFRNGRLCREAAKRVAVATATPYLNADLPITHDRAEAWAMARYAWGWARTHADQLGQINPQVTP